MAMSRPSQRPNLEVRLGASGEVVGRLRLSNGKRSAFSYDEEWLQTGATGGKVQTSIADTENDATDLLAQVEVAATYKLAGVDRTKAESLFHKPFASAQLDLTIQDHFGKPVKPRERFLVPLPVIDEAVQRRQDGTIVNMVSAPEAGKLVAG